MRSDKLTAFIHASTPVICSLDVSFICTYSVAMKHRSH